MILVIGAGVAGISCALAAAASGAAVELVTPGEFAGGVADALAGGNTALAQGGIAASIGAGDSAQLHHADTLAAGAGLVDAEASWQLVTEGASSVERLLASGFAVDRGSDGLPSLGLEAAHSVARIVHAGEDQTGASLHRYLTTRLLAEVAAGRIRLIEHATAVSLLGESGTVQGAVLRGRGGDLTAVRADAVVLATGGYAGTFARTSNHAGAQGQGILLAARAGAMVADLEFVQFHPTVLGDTGTLVSEAVRGAGAVLRDGRGDRFLQAVHPAAELAPRDVVARAISRLLDERGEPFVWLDATAIEREQGAGTLAKRFPNITKAVHELGLDWTREAIPVAPAAHYSMGGVATDLDGRTSVPGLFAAGETAATGVHGANRLASNSLLEGLVFGRRAAEAAVAFSGVRSAAGAWSYRGGSMPALERGALELPEASTLEGMMVVAAAARTESRGAHQRADCAATDPAQASRRGWALRTGTLDGDEAEVATEVSADDSNQRSLAAC